MVLYCKILSSKILIVETRRDMRLFLAIIVLSVFGFAKVNIADPYKKIDYFELENGMKVYLLSDNKAVNTQISIEVNVGYDTEDAKNYGLSHLVEHIIFRDQRIPYHDYLDYIKEEGGIEVNGYTSRYKTKYFTTIDSAKSYWIAQTFAQMLFDKKVIQEDLEVEKGALQAEIGEIQWHNKFLWDMRSFLKVIFPPSEDMYEDEFMLSKPKELPPYYYAQENNKNFTLEQIKKHYETYYYPANMTLFMVGNFDVHKMKELIVADYGKVQKTGSASTVEPPKNPKLNDRPYLRFYEGADENSAYIGAKYILDDYKKYLILSIYTRDLAERLQQHMRNIEGKTYSVNSYHFYDRKAGVAAVSFDGLHDDFQSNIEYVKTTIENDMKHLSDTIIQEAIDQYGKEVYASIEHDSHSLMDTVLTSRYMRKEHNITKQTSYEVFSSITPEEYRAVLAETFIPNNYYSYITRDYYFFPLEMYAISILAFIFLFIIYFWLYRIDLKGFRMMYTQRDIVMQRRVTNRFVGFLIFVFIFILSSIVWEWGKYLISKYLMGDPFYLTTIDVPYSYIFTALDPVFYLFVFILLYRYLFSYYARLDVVENAMYAIGSKVKVFPKEEIESVEVAPWSVKNCRKIIGSMVRFWKPLVRINMKDGSIYYIRASQAEHLKEDIGKWIIAKNS